MNNPKINIGLLLELMNRDGWTSNAIEYVERAVNEFDKNQSVIGKLTAEVDRLQHSNKRMLSALGQLRDVFIAGSSTVEMIDEAMDGK